MEHLNAIALTMLKPELPPLQLIQIYREAGSATAIADNYNHIETVIPEPTERLKEVLLSFPEALKKAEEEIAFCEKHHIQILIPSDKAYPLRLENCADAPLVLYYRGTANLNSARIINIIGTRKITSYGQNIIQSFIRDLKKASPDTLVVSGLAYGVDICSHRNALDNGMNTVGVVAHGLDMIYPSLHRDTAKQMVSHGGLLTEYPRFTRPEKRNFVQRNRIVAGISDATILVESASRGGGLITCNISEGYGREVYAFPGPVNKPMSEGCNNLIRDNGAHLITCADDFIKSMGWECDAILQEAKKKGIERELFPVLNDKEEKVVNALQKLGDAELNLISSTTGLSISELNSTLFILEMNGVVRSLAGGKYCLC